LLDPTAQEKSDLFGHVSFVFSTFFTSGVKFNNPHTDDYDGLLENNWFYSTRNNYSF